MKQIIVKYILIPVLCLSSGAAFYYLNSVKLPKPSTVVAEAKPKKEQRKIVITDPKTKKKQLIVIDPPKWIDTSEVVRTESSKDKPKPIEDKRGLLPDVELLKFVIQKGREGIPVLSLKNFVKFW